MFCPLLNFSVYCMSGTFELYNSAELKGTLTRSCGFLQDPVNSRERTKTAAKY